MSETFGQALRRLRGSLSVRDLAGLAHCGKSHVSDLENGKRRPTSQLAAALDQALKADGELLARADQQAGRHTGSPGTGPQGEVVPADRRTFLEGATAVALNMGVNPPRHVDPALIGYFRLQLAGHYQADMLLGPRALIETVSAQCKLIGSLVDSADGPTRLGMAQVGVSFATFAAWLHLDAGDPTTALRWHDVAQEWAHRAHDRDAVACALVDRAMARTDQGAGTAVVDLCQAALMDAGKLTPEVRVFALQQQAHGASLRGERKEVDRLLDAASRLLDRVDVERWGTACLRTPHYVEVQRATCYGRLGAAGEANELWQRIIPAAPAAARRDVGVWAARQAVHQRRCGSLNGLWNCRVRPSASPLRRDRPAHGGSWPWWIAP